MMAGRFAGDVSCTEAWQALAATPEAVLVDVRTRAEWAYVGVPDLAPLGRSLVQVEWQRFPGGMRNSDFVAEIRAQGITAEQPVYLLCRSGVRSAAAAEALAQEGYTTHNVADGFEGQLDGAGHRGCLGGWKAAGLPWVQG